MLLVCLAKNLRIPVTNNMHCNVFFRSPVLFLLLSKIVSFGQLKWNLPRQSFDEDSVCCWLKAQGPPYRLKINKQWAIFGVILEKYLLQWLKVTSVCLFEFLRPLKVLLRHIVWGKPLRRRRQTHLQGWESLLTKKSETWIKILKVCWNDAISTVWQPLGL